MIKGIIYDLDGTLIDTQKMHEEAWRQACALVGFVPTKEMLSQQRGRRDEEAAREIFLPNRPEDTEGLANAKNRIVGELASTIPMFSQVVETINKLNEQGYRVWICTSASPEFVEKVLNALPDFCIPRAHIVSREQYTAGKPSPEALLLTCKLMELAPANAAYVGDMKYDYQASQNAKISFVYFVAPGTDDDLAIPLSVPRIHSHEEIFQLLK